MNSNFGSVSSNFREAEAVQRGDRLRHDWHVREAITHYLAHCSPLGVNVDSLLAPYRYLDNVAEADFRWRER